MTDTVNVLREVVMAALNRVLPVSYRDGHDYAELTFGESKTKAMTLEPETWMVLNDIPDLLAAAPKAEPVSDHQDIEDLIADAIGDSIDVDWTSRDGAKAVVRALEKEGLTILAQPEAPKVEQEPVVARSIEGETVSGFKVAAWRYLGPQDTGEFGHRYCEHWSTVGNRPKEVTRLFTEEQLLSALYTHPAPSSELLEALEAIKALDGEINEKNYTHDDVCELNNSFVEAWNIADRAIAKHKGPQS